MLRLSLIAFLLTNRIHTALVTDRPPHINRFDKLYEKLEKLSNAPGRDPTPEEKLYEKLDELNSLSPDRLELMEEDEDLLSAMQTWISAERMAGVVKDLQRMKEERGGSKEVEEYGDSDWNEEDSDSEGDYHMDANDDWEPEDSPDVSATSKPVMLGISPSAITRTSASSSATKRAEENALAAAEAIAATNTRPKISAIMSAEEEVRQRHVAMQSYLKLWQNGKCNEPQPRWLTIKQLAPAADTQYLPPCLQLHRCAPDAGCCINDSEACAPIEGKTVSFPIALRKADGSFRAFKMQFFNHTKCACVSRAKLRHSIARVGKASYEAQDEEEPTRPSERPERLPVPEQRSARREVSSERQNDWRAPTEGPTVEKDEEVTAPPQLRRCTCPALFLANMSANEPCSCVCNWPDIMRRRDCQSLARGKENFGLRDRVCVTTGNCTQPSCEFGAYDVQNGKCPVQSGKYPLRRYRRMRFRGHGRYQPEKTVVV